MKILTLSLLTFASITSTVLSQDSPQQCQAEDTAFITGCLGPMIDISQTLALRNPRINRLTFPLFYFNSRDIIAVCETWLDIIRHCITPDLLQRCPSHGLFTLLEPLFGYACSERQGQRFFAQYACINSVVMPIESCTRYIQAPQDPNAARDRCKSFPNYFACVKSAVESTCGFQAVDLMTQAINYYGCPVGFSHIPGIESQPRPNGFEQNNFGNGGNQATNQFNQPIIIPPGGGPGFQGGNAGGGFQRFQGGATSNLPLRTIFPGTARPSEVQDTRRNQELTGQQGFQEADSVLSNIFETQKTAQTAEITPPRTQPLTTTMRQSTRQTTTKVMTSPTTTSQAATTTTKIVTNPPTTTAERRTTTAEKTAPPSTSRAASTHSPSISPEITTSTTQKASSMTNTGRQTSQSSSTTGAKTDTTSRDPSRTSTDMLLTDPTVAAVTKTDSTKVTTGTTRQQTSATSQDASSSTVRKATSTSQEASPSTTRIATTTTTQKASPSTTQQAATTTQEASSSTTQKATTTTIKASPSTTLKEVRATTTSKMLTTTPTTRTETSTVSAAAVVDAEDNRVDTEAEVVEVEKVKSCTSRRRTDSHKCLEPLIQIWYNRSLENRALKEMVLGILIMKREHVLELCDHYASSFLDCQLETFYQCRDDDLVKFADRNFGYACGNAPVFFRKFDCLSVITKDNEECRQHLKLDPNASTEGQCQELWKFYKCTLPEIEQLCSDNTSQILREAITYFGCSEDLLFE